jgi:hypothetical protein
LSRSQRAGKVRYDLALRDGAGKTHIFYGVADDAMDTRWKELIQATMPPADNEPTELPADSTDSASTAPVSEQAGGVAEGDIVQPTRADAEASTFADTPVAESPLVSDNPPVPETQS